MLLVLPAWVFVLEVAFGFDFGLGCFILSTMSLHLVVLVNQNCNTDVYMGLYSDVGSCLGFANVRNKSNML